MNSHSRQTSFKPFGGFTLIELLAAITLAAGLSVAILGLIAQQLSKAQLGKQTNLHPTLSILKWDIKHATSIKQIEDYLSLNTQCSIDPATQSLRFEPAIINYQIKSISGNSYLVRTQTIIKSNSKLKDNPPIQTQQIIAKNINAFSLEDQPNPNQATDQTSSQTNLTPVNNIGKIIQINITSNDSKRTQTYYFSPLSIHNP